MRWRNDENSSFNGRADHGGNTAFADSENFDQDTPGLTSAELGCAV